MKNKPPARYRRGPVRSETRPDDERLVQSAPPVSRLVTLRHHPILWLVPAVLLLLALLPWPYGFYTFLRLSVCLVCSWLAYEQWKHDDAVSGWVVGLSTVALLYNPLLPVHLSREIWMVLNIGSAVLIIGHLWALRRLLSDIRTLTPAQENDSLGRDSQQRTPIQDRTLNP